RAVGVEGAGEAAGEERRGVDGGAEAEGGAGGGEEAGERGAAGVERDDRWGWNGEERRRQLGERAARPDLQPEVGEAARRRQGRREAHRRGELGEEQAGKAGVGGLLGEEA